MTKKEFENSKEPLVMIVSFDPETGKSIWDTYDWKTADESMENFKKGLPNLMHFKVSNMAATEAIHENYTCY